MSDSRTVEILPDAGALARRGADLFARRARECVRESGRFSVALAGGSTPRAMYALLAADADPPLPWEAIHLFWGDERPVPPDHADSNYRMVRESLLEAAGVPAASIHRIPAEVEPPEEAARRYEEELKRTVPPAGGRLPALDLVLLGLGADGHTASLFPGSALAAEQTRLVVSGMVPSLGGPRISLTFPVLNAARGAVFLVSGRSKASMVRRILEQEPSPEEIPAAGIAPAGGGPIWLLDGDAASLLRGGS